ncbi:MAG TPA: TIGR03067 domain-containing protein, partial [Gemmatimonadaceae bacterium]|nr:TIGR03067 domain-containing protein [Gemmatimonadaceae bacterium]
MSRTPTRRSNVDHLRALEGEWSFESLRVDGNDMPGAMIGGSKLLMHGDRFRMESPEAAYDGRFTIDASANPMQIDITFVEGPEAGNASYGIFELAGDDRLTICLGLVGSSRPRAFESAAGTGHALERLRRVSAAAPVDVTGGVAAAPGKAGNAGKESGVAVNTDDFDASPSPMLRRLEGPWLPVRLVMNAEEMRADWLSFGLRTGTGNETKVVFGGQTMLHAKTRIDDT